jgi:hypothetical protein
VAFFSSDEAQDVAGDEAKDGARGRCNPDDDEGLWLLGVRDRAPAGAGTAVRVGATDKTGTRVPDVCWGEDPRGSPIVGVLQFADVLALVPCCCFRRRPQNLPHFLWRLLGGGGDGAENTTVVVVVVVVTRAAAAVACCCLRFSLQLENEVCARKT